MVSPHNTIHNNNDNELDEISVFERNSLRLGGGGGIVFLGGRGGLKKGGD